MLLYLKIYSAFRVDRSYIFVTVLSFVIEVIVGPLEESKQKAKDALCIKVITEELGLEMPTNVTGVKKGSIILSPCYALHTLMIKQYVCHYFCFFVIVFCKVDSCHYLKFVHSKTNLLSEALGVRAEFF